MNIALLKKYLLLIFISTLPLSMMFAQSVTIGSGYKARAGALLDLKETDEIGANSTKGMMLPRVKVVSPSDLLPLVKKSEVNPLVYSGSIVYNTNACLTLSGDDYGPMMWTGEQWDLLWTKNRNPEVGLLKDHEGNEYRYRTFGAAGTWMIDNLRTKTYPPHMTNVVEQMSPQLMANRGYGFPNLTSSMLEEDDYFNNYPIVGLLYTVPAIYNLDMIKLKDYRSFKDLPSICPAGWRIPNLQEWDDLIDEMMDNQNKYSNPTEKVNHRNFFKLAISPCPTKINAQDDEKIKGWSLPPDQGGANILPTGFIPEVQGIAIGDRAYFITTDNEGAVGAQAELFYYSGISWTAGNAELRSALYDVAAVRCKKVE